MKMKKGYKKGGMKRASMPVPKGKAAPKRRKRK